MVQVIEDHYQWEEDFGLNNFIARETSPHSVNAVDSDTAPRDDRERASRKPGTEKGSLGSKYQLWPVIRKPVRQSTQERTLTMSQSNPALRDASPSVSRRPSLKFKNKEASLTSRRQRSIPELGLGPMTTVQEALLDSPTIPGRFPVHERSNSAPGATFKKSPLAESVLSSIHEPTGQKLDGGIDLLGVDHSRSNPRKSLKRASSLLLPQDMANLVTSVNQSLAEMPVDDADDADDTPPAVPPKSPRMALRLQTRSNHAPSSSTVSTPVPITAPEIRRSPNIFDSPILPTSVYSKPFSAVERQPSPNFWASPRRSKSRGLEIGTTTQDGLRQASPNPSISSKSTTNTSEHKREGSETSILDRGRPTKRVDGVVKPKLKSSVFSPEQESSASLPPGVPASDASSKFPKAELERLQRHAIGQAEHFDMLSHKDMKSLSRELRVLDERCDYLRHTHNSLRSGRRNLQTRMITYLKSPRLSKFSRESILKQEEALAELDISIDEWVAKLEQAETRRAKTQERLLQHCAAALILQREPTGMSASSPYMDKHTPPRSPDKTLSPQTPEHRRAVESIKVYADSDVYALLADIEKEMDLMVESKAGTSFCESGSYSYTL